MRRGAATPPRPRTSPPITNTHPPVRCVRRHTVSLDSVHGVRIPTNQWLNPASGSSEEDEQQADTERHEAVV